jgi:hypothetical protein
MMRKWLIAGLVIFLWISIGRSQESQGMQDPLETFKQQSETYYHYLATPGIDNFSCYISSGRYIDFIKDKADSSFYYPLKFIWTKEGNGYYILQPFPELSDSLRRLALVHAQTIKNLYGDMLFDLQKLYYKRPVAEIPSNAAITFSKDTVGIKIVDQGKGTVNETYTRAGQLIRVLWQSGEQKAAIYPFYKEVRGKWLCLGWQNQAYKENQVVSGTKVWVDYAPAEDKFLPTRLSILAQEKKDSGENVATGNYVLFMKDYVFNENITEIVNPQTSGPTPPQQQ